METVKSASTFTTVLFILLVLVVVRLTVFAMQRTGRGNRTGLVVSAVFVALYLVVPGALAGAGLLNRYDPMPAPVFLILIVLTALNVAFVFSSFGTRLIEWAGLTALVSFQVFRVPVELLLHRLHVEGVIPVQMTYAGRNFDILTGITAVLVGFWLARGRPPRSLILAWNVLGLALLVNIVAIAVLSTPVAFRRFTDGLPNLLPGTFPFVWLPTILVQAALFSHLAVFRSLARGTSRPQSAA